MAAKAPSARTKLRSVEAETWTIPGFDEPFVQDPLTFFEKNEFLALVSRAVEDVIMTTGDLNSILNLLSLTREDVDKLQSGEMDESLAMATPGLVGALARLVSMVPSLMEEMYLLALSVPADKRQGVREGLRLIDDDTGFGILEAFVEQNIQTLRDFFPRWRVLAENTIKKFSTPPEDESSPISIV